MKLPHKKRDQTSATITQALGLILALSGLVVVTSFAADPSWWSTPGPGSTPSAVMAEQVVTNSGVVTTNYVPSPYAAVTQGQLKQFTARAVAQLNTNLPGGAGTNLNTMVSNWASDYATNGYSATNIEPSDYNAIAVGQLKYIGNKVWTQLIAGGYTNAVPAWLDDTNTNNALANLGQLKTIFNFDTSSFPSAPHLTSSTTASGTVGVAFSYTITASNSPTSFGVTGVLPGLSVNTSTGVISGTPTAAGNYLLTLSMTNSSGTSYATLMISISQAVPVITSGTTASGVAGSVFDYAITANNSPTSFSASGLPSGLSVNTSTGVISGTPTAAGTSTITLGASNAGGSATPVTLTLTISNPPVPVITSGTTASGDDGIAFSYTITASNSPTSFSATGLPAGLSVNTSTGMISGTPTSTGTSTVTLGASNAGGSASSVTLTLTINGASAPVITSALTANVLMGVAFSYTITASNTPTSYSETGTLPTGLSFSSGVISGTPTGAGTSTVPVTIGATNSGGTGSATLVFSVNPPPPVITSTTTATGNVGAAFSYAITASNSPTSFSATGLPAGLSINTSTGAISGTPTVAGTSTVTLGASNAGGAASSVTLTLVINFLTPVPVINSSPTATGDVGVAFSYTITTATLNSGVTFSASGLPSTLSINSSTGVISGTPTASSTYSVTLGASDSSGTGTEALSLTINPAGAPVISSATTANGDVGVAFSYSITASNTPTSYGATGLPVGLSINTSTGVISGTPISTGGSTVTISATNSIGTGTAVITLTINPPAPVIISATTDSGTFGVTITPYTITASTSPTSFSATGLPPGLMVDAFTGMITGTPTASGTFSTTIGATNAGGTGTTTLTFTIAGFGSSPILTDSIAGGDLHSLMIKTDGTVWAEGSNWAGDLGNGTFTDSTPYTPVTVVSGFTNIIAVAAGGVTSFALKSDGTVWAWGRNDYGELGNGTDGGGTDSADGDVPGQISGLSGVIAISGGEYFAMALKGDGTVWTWGSNSDGALGNPSAPSNSDTPVEVYTSSGILTGIIAISAGTTNGMALKSDGTVWEWGNDGDNEFGDSGFTGGAYAVQVPSLSGITAISCGEFYSLALKSDGTVWAWGINDCGQLGNGTSVVNTGDPSFTGPVQVSNLSGIISIDCGGDHALALKNDGTVWAWGNNASAGLGNGTDTGYSNVPVQVPNLTGVIVLGAGNYQNTVLKSDGSVWGWGANVLYSFVPIEVDNRQATSPPTISPAAGSYMSSQTVSISTTLTGTIHYTLDGTEPTSSSPTYTGSFTLSGSALVSAEVFSGTASISPEASTQYYIDDTGDTGLPTEATSLSVTAASSSEIDLSWTLSGLVNYSAVDVYRSSDGGSTYQLIAVLGSSTTSYADTNVQDGTNYKYYVGTINSSGQSDTSASSSVTPTSATTLTITVTTPSGATPLP